MRFGPQDAALRQAVRDQQTQYRTTVKTERGAAQGIIGEVNRVTPGVKAGYDAAGLAAARSAHEVIDPTLAKLGASAAPMVAATKIEQAGLQTRLAESKAAAVSDLGSRRVQAQEGAAFATTNARNNLIQGLAKIFRSQQDLAGQKGAFAQATVSQLEKAAQDRALRVQLNSSSNAQSERNSIRSSGVDPNTGRPIKGGKLDPKAKKNGSGFGPNGASTDKHVQWQSSIQEIASTAQRYKGKLSREQIVQKLAAGRPPQRILVDKAGNPLPDGLTGAQKVAAGAHTVALPAIKQYAPDLRMTAALDVALDGHLSPATQRKLHRAGFSVKQLNLPTFADWQRQQRAASRPGLAPGVSGQLRPT